MSIPFAGLALILGTPERRILATLHGPQYFDFSSIIGWKAFEESVKLFGADHEFTKLVVDLKDKDPDDAFSSIPYEKGFNFLYYLDRLVGREKWDKFIRHVSEEASRVPDRRLMGSEYSISRSSTTRL